LIVNTTKLVLYLCPLFPQGSHVFVDTAHALNAALSRSHAHLNLENPSIISLSFSLSIKSIYHQSLSFSLSLSHLSRPLGTFEQAVEFVRIIFKPKKLLAVAPC